MADVLIATAMRLEGRAVRTSTSTVAPLVTGVGARRASRTGGRLAMTDGPSVGVVGFAGGLRPDHRPGQVVVASELRFADRPGTVLRLPAAPAVAEQLRHAGLEVVEGPIVSSRTPVWGRRRAELAADAVAVDMESAWLAEGLLERDPRRVAVVRVLVDTPAAELYSPRVWRAALASYRTLRRVAPVVEQWGRAVGERKVLLAQPRSFCAGVDRAIAVVRRALDIYGAPVYVRRQIVHNTHVVRELESAGAIFVREVDEVPPGAVMVLAAHGVAPEVRTGAIERGLRVIDATCPLVAKVHAEARSKSREGYSIVLIGHADHEEVEGTRGEAPGAIQVNSEPGEIGSLDIADPSRVAYLTQTTLAIDETAAVVDALTQQFPEIVGPRADDICYASQNRQEAVHALARECDLLLVIGSKNSSNSNRLVEVARRDGCTAHLIEDESEIDLSWLHGVGSVGITAGASAPESVVHGVVRRLECLGPVDLAERATSFEDVHFQLPAEVR
jgi:4-hydroxy-3-methylbut-2-enyl diphosphate reductase